MATKLWNLSHQKALHTKWIQGRKRLGKEWAGKHPLVEAYEESLDLAIYLRLCNGDANTLTQSADAICAQVRQLLKAADKAGINLEKWEEQKDFVW